tara:strand:+ start:2733 stop:2921 length:189 start_codon:yes stop_codon:yes gene_type:complete
MPTLMYPLVPRAPCARPVAAHPPVAVRDYMLSPAAVAAREKRLLREAQVARQSQQSNETNGG